MRIFITGTDTDVGKTRVTAALGRVLAARGRRDGIGTTIVKLVQTGLLPGEHGDAYQAAALAGCEAIELQRFALAADPWNAALAEAAEPPTVAKLEDELAAIRGNVIVEGSGGAAVPLNARETIADVAARAGLPAIIVVGLRLGCISHALMTADYLRARSIEVLGAILVDRFGTTGLPYVAQVERALRVVVPVLGVLPYEQDLAAGVAQGETILTHVGALTS